MCQEQFWFDYLIQSISTVIHFIWKYDFHFLTYFDFSIWFALCCFNDSSTLAAWTPQVSVKYHDNVFQHDLRIIQRASSASIGPTNVCTWSMSLIYLSDLYPKSSEFWIFLYYIFIISFLCFNFFLNSVVLDFWILLYLLNVWYWFCYFMLLLTPLLFCFVIRKETGRGEGKGEKRTRGKRYSVLSSYK